MCGLWAYILTNESVSLGEHWQTDHAFKAARRGPDQVCEVRNEQKSFIMVFHRLAIHDLTVNGKQPFHFRFEDGSVLYLMCNGEIYNYRRLIKDCALDKRLIGKSDCEVICHLLKACEWNVQDVCEKLEGEYAFVAHVTTPNGNTRILAGRDKYGVRPLYYAITPDGMLFCSMLAGCNGALEKQQPPEHFPPGHTLDTARPTKLLPFHLSLPIPSFHTTTELGKAYTYITNALIEAVRVRLDSERPIGFLLSGGLDSSLIVAIATKILGYKKPHTFSIAFDYDAPDIMYAQIVANHLDTSHSTIIMSPDEAIKTLPAVISAIETYDTTTVRASVPQYLLAKHISSNTDIRVIMNGDGSDEISMGYLYNYYAPNDEEAMADTYNLLNMIHCFDGLRVDRTLGAHGLEARVPFLDPRYVQSYLSLPVAWRRPSSIRMEKQLLRDAFDILYPDLLPNDVLYRGKEAFSDGVNKKITSSWFHTLDNEQDYYRTMFDKEFPNASHILPYYWMPKWTSATDPSARTLSVYK